MLQTIPISNIGAMGAALFIGVLAPLFLIIALLVKGRVTPKPMFTGMAVFTVCLIIAIVTGQIASVYIKNSAILFAVLSLRAGLVEETGRMVAFRFFLKKNGKPSDGLSYGLGHGFCEAALLLGLSYISYIYTAVMINSGMLSSTLTGADPAMAEAYGQLAEVLISTPAISFLFAGVERLSAIAFHVAASLLVCCAVRTGKYRLYGLAILLHTGFNCLALPMTLGVMGMVSTEIMLAVAAAAILIFALRLTRRPNKNYITEVQPVYELEDDS